MLPYIWRTHKTSVNQLARTLGMEREEVSSAIKVHKIEV